MLWVCLLLLLPFFFLTESVKRVSSIEYRVLYYKHLHFVCITNIIFVMSELLPHTVTVCRLYRRALRTCIDWYVHQDHLRKASVGVRCIFKKYQNEIDPAKIDLLLTTTESILNRLRHPEPYLRSWI
jgi:Complex 1 protein (LYR family)